MSAALQVRPGDVSGRLTITELTTMTEKSGQVVRAARCRCSCGTEVLVRLYALKRTRSCGCLRRELSADRVRQSKPSTVHGLSTHPLYKTWSDMKQRCHNPNNQRYVDYGARGIAVCDEWRSDPVAFIEYAEKLPHYGEPGYSIDRIDNERGYGPGNVKFSTASEQSRNSRSAKLNQAKADEMRRLHATGEYTVGTLAGMFGVGYKSALDVIHNRRWVRAGTRAQTTPDSDIEADSGRPRRRSVQVRAA